VGYFEESQYFYLVKISQSQQTTPNSAGKMQMLDCAYLQDISLVIIFRSGVYHGKFHNYTQQFLELPFFLGNLQFSVFSA
jgi:hypothetical protein